MICATITAATNREARADLALAASKADLAELRLDYLQERPDLEALLADRPCPVIVTNRPARQGGFFSGGEPERVAPLREAAELGADYIDLEYDAAGRLPDRFGSKIIVSYHDFEKTPDDIHRIAQMLLGTGADVIKIATYVNDITESFRLCQLAFDIGVPKIVVGMGPKGIPTRVLTRKFGGFLTYASLKRGSGSAPGQLTVDDLRNLYNFYSDKARYRRLRRHRQPHRPQREPPYPQCGVSPLGHERRLRAVRGRRPVELPRRLPLHGPGGIQRHDPPQGGGAAFGERDRRYLARDRRGQHHRRPRRPPRGHEYRLALGHQRNQGRAPEGRDAGRQAGASPRRRRRGARNRLWPRPRGREGDDLQPHALAPSGSRPTWEPSTLRGSAAARSPATLSPTAPPSACILPSRQPPCRKRH